MSTRTIDPPVSASTPAGKPGETHRSHPVAIEIPVTVQGSRSASGHQLPQQFVEETRTVLVFVEGGVLRISEEVAPGQFLILKNLCTDQETPCVVVPKNIGSAKGYVEVEFAQPADGFWGVDFSTGQASVEAAAPLKREPSAPVPIKAARARESFARSSKLFGGCSAIGRRRGADEEGARRCVFIATAPFHKINSRACKTAR